MENPALSHTMPSQPKGWRTYASVGVVVTLHLLALWALAKGLGVTISTFITPPTTVHVIDTPTHPHEIPPPNPTMKTPPSTEVPTPHIAIDSSTPPNTGIQTFPNPPQTTNVPADTAPSAVPGTHMIPPYPALARRLGQEGTVVLALTIGTDGTVTDAQVTTSSGFGELDQAAVEWVKAHWRYKPATHAGNPVPGTARTSVKFALQNVR